MEIVSTAVYVGPNVYAKRPLIRLTVDLHRRAARPVSDYDDALGPLFDELPGLLTAASEVTMSQLNRTNRYSSLSRMRSWSLCAPNPLGPSSSSMAGPMP